MTQAQPLSLRWHLVRRLVVLQATMLALLVLFIVAALWGTGFLISLEPEDDTIDALREAIARDATGGYLVRETPAIAQMARAISQFLVRDPGPGRTFGFAGQGAARICRHRRRARWRRPGAARLEHGRRAAPDGADEVDRYIGRQRPDSDRGGRRGVLAAGRAGDLDRLSRRRLAHRRADDPGNAYRHAHRGASNPRRPCAARRRKPRRSTSTGAASSCPLQAVPLGNRSAGIRRQRRPAPTR